jgi:putative hemolysin
MGLYIEVPEVMTRWLSSASPLVQRSGHTASSFYINTHNTQVTKRGQRGKGGEDSQRPRGNAVAKCLLPTEGLIEKITA